MGPPLDPQELLALPYPNWAGGRGAAPPSPHTAAATASSPSAAAAATAAGQHAPPPPPLGLPFGLPSMFDQSEDGYAHAHDSLSNDMKPTQKHNHHRRKSVKTMRYGGRPAGAAPPADKDVDAIKVSRRVLKGKRGLRG